MSEPSHFYSSSNPSAFTPFPAVSQRVVSAYYMWSVLHTADSSTRKLHREAVEVGWWRGVGWVGRGVVGW